jgi:hypothetical protein
MSDARDDDGGPAFPVPMVFDGAVVDTVNERGMSRRDYFAAHAYIPHELEAAVVTRSATLVDVIPLLASWCFTWAEAMLEESKHRSAASSSATTTASDASSRNAETPAPSEARPAEGSDR